MNNQEKQNIFLKWIEPIIPDIEKYALYLTKNREIAKDIVGETILILFENIEKINEKKAFLGYAITIVRRIYFHNLKKMKHIKTNHADLESLFMCDASQEIQTDIKILYETIDELPLKQKEALILQTILGYSQGEISKIQNSTVAAVKVRIFRAKKKLKKLLGEDR